MKFEIDTIVTGGLDAAVKGTMTMPKAGSGKTYAFCDFYRLNNAEESKVREMTSFVIEIK